MKLLFLGFDALDGKRCLSKGGIFENWNGLRCICEPEIASTGPSWATIYTGLKVADHGVTDCWGRPNKGDTVWNHDCIWDALDMRVGLLGLPVMWPVRAVNGWAVAGVPAPIMDERGRWPRDLDTKDYIIDYMNAVMPGGPQIWLWREKATSPEQAWTVMKDVAWSHAQIAARLYVRDRVDALFVGFTFPDRFGHMRQGFGNFSENKWAPIDALALEITNMFMDRLAPEVTVVVSDHGFDTKGHTPNGILLLSGPNTPTGEGTCRNWEVKRMVLEATCESK